MYGPKMNPDRASSIGNTPTIPLVDERVRFLLLLLRERKKIENANCYFCRL
jgi:hypothetical protein